MTLHHGRTCTRSWETERKPGLPDARQWFTWAVPTKSAGESARRIVANPGRASGKNSCSRGARAAESASRPTSTNQSTWCRTIHRQGSDLEIDPVRSPASTGSVRVHGEDYRQEEPAVPGVKTFRGVPTGPAWACHIDSPQESLWLWQRNGPTNSMPLDLFATAHTGTSRLGPSPILRRRGTRPSRRIYEYAWTSATCIEEVGVLALVTVCHDDVLAEATASSSMIS